MSLIKLYASGVSIDFVKESLSIKKENNSFTSDFKVSHSSYPFLIVENKNTKLTLGPRDLTSVNKKKVVPVVVDEAGITYYGELQLVSYLNGFRKYNLKFASDILKISNKQIGEFMPVVSVIPGEDNPEPYAETVSEPIALQGWWANFHFPVRDHCFPEAKWQFPLMNWQDKYEVTDDETEDWHLWMGSINNQDDDGFLIYNEFANIPEGRIFSNKNVIAPQVFLLSPIFYALESIGYNLKGSFPNNEFIKRLLILSFNDNMSEIASENQQIDLGSVTPVGNEWVYRLTTTRSGDYNFSLKASAPPSSGSTFPRIKYGMGVAIGSRRFQVFVHYGADGIGMNVDTDFTFNVLPSEIGLDLRIYYQHVNGLFMDPFSLSLDIKDFNTGYQANTTVDFSRFVPEMTLPQYLTELKNLFNLEINIDDFKKTLTIDFNEEKIEDSKSLLINKSLAVGSYELAESTCFLLKYENEQDESLWIEKSGISQFVSQTSDYLKTIKSKFKFVPNNGVTAQLSEELKEKEGIGLMIYDPIFSPNVSKTFDGLNLNINGVGGIYETRWKKWLKFRLNAGILEMTGPFSESEVSKILKTNRIYVDRQEYMISSLDYVETKEGNLEVKFKLESINF